MEKSIKILIGIGGVIIFFIIMLIIFGNKSETFTVSFYTDGGSKVEFQLIKEGESASRPTDPTKEGYIFDDWYVGNDIYDFSSKVDKDITLYAKWYESDGEEDVIAKKIVVIFDSNGGSVVESQTVEENGIINKPTNPTKKNYQFVSWQLDGEDFDFDSKITRDITLVAKWKKSTTTDDNEDEENDVNEIAKKFIVTFNTNGGNSIASQKVQEGNKANKPTDPTRSGYTFKGWYYNGSAFNFNTKITANVTLVAKWEENQVVTYKTVTFNTDGGNSIASQQVQEGNKATKPTDPTRSGYTFKGWYYNGSAFNFDTKITANITLVAKWEENVVVTYKTVTFNTDGGNSIASQQVQEGNKVTKPTDPTKSGYTFKGWYYNDSVFNFNTEITANITLVAKWEENIVVTYKVEETGSFVGQVKIFVIKNSNEKVDGLIDIELSNGSIRKDVSVSKDGLIINKDKYKSISNPRIE